MSRSIVGALKIITLALILSFGLSYVYAWTAPTATPPGGNVSAPLNTSATAQTKSGNLTVGGLTTGTLKLSTGAGSSKVLTSDANGNATWQPAVSGADNLGNHTATQALNLGANNIVASGSDTTYGATTIQGTKNSWSGINFKDAAGTTNYGTLMMHPSTSGFFNASDTNWRMFVTDGGVNSYGNVYASDYYSQVTGKWMSGMQTRVSGSCAVGQAITAINADGTVTCGAAGGGGGFGTTWTNVTASRSAGALYTNNTGKYIQVAVHVTNTNGASQTVGAQLYISGLPVSDFSAFNFSYRWVLTLTGIVPPGATYSVVLGNPTMGGTYAPIQYIHAWYELL